MVNKPNKVKGFTLVEVVLVLIVLSAIAAIALPIPSTMEKKYLQRASLELKSDIEHIQNMVQTTGVDYIIEFTNSGAYGVYEKSVLVEPKKWVTPTGIKRFSKNNGMVVAFTKNGTTKNGSTTITFYTNKFFQETTVSLGTGHVVVKGIGNISSIPNSY